MSTNNFTLGNANNESILHIFNNLKMKKLRMKLLKISYELKIITDKLRCSWYYLKRTTV